jgi:hypothetical protein
MLFSETYWAQSPGRLTEYNSLGRYGEVKNSFGATAKTKQILRFAKDDN